MTYTAGGHTRVECLREAARWLQQEPPDDAPHDWGYSRSAIERIARWLRTDTRTHEEANDA
jgi:hypothetical protein